LLGIFALASVAPSQDTAKQDPAANDQQEVSSKVVHKPEHRWNPTVLTAYGDQDIDSWGPRYIWGRFQTYRWNIN
jgi:hypothetical protein